ncbi:hypothetical protein B0H13DRAFT_1884631 [Mycena leptocephala]|nr:hypothetical protein B0H13DRAFT_1884631 [Mycena leptocephala]
MYEQLTDRGHRYPLGAEPTQDGDASDLEADHNSAFGEVPDPTYISAQMSFAGSHSVVKQATFSGNHRQVRIGASAAEDGAEPSVQEESTVATASAPTVPIEGTQTVIAGSSEASHVTLLSSYHIPSIVVLGHGSQGLKTVPLPVGQPTIRGEFQSRFQPALHSPYPFLSITLVQFETEFPLLPFDSLRSSRSGRRSDIEDKDLPENSLVVAHVTLVIEDELTSDTYELAADSYGGITIMF